MELTVNNPQEPLQKVWVPFGKHKSKATEFQLPFTLESSGTQGAFVLLSRLLHTLEIGGLAVIDEFENDLHPHMLEPILELFANPATNPHQAQLLFTCHAIEVLNLVHKSQVILVQKNEDCESTACRLDAVEGIRNDDNYYANKWLALWAQCQFSD
jgi:predicted ATPase